MSNMKSKFPTMVAVQLVNRAQWRSGNGASLPCTDTRMEPFAQPHRGALVIELGTNKLRSEFSFPNSALHRKTNLSP